jgi:hypothetical protein
VKLLVGENPRIGALLALLREPPKSFPKDAGHGPR